MTAATLSCLLSTPLVASINGGNDLRLSDMGGSGSTSGLGLNASVAYGSTPREYLIVWEGAESSPASQQLRIYGQRVHAETGAEVGNNDFVLAEVAGGPNINLDARQPAVSYSPTVNRFLVVYTADVNTGSTEIDVHGRLVNADGTFLGAPFEVGDCGAPGNTSADVGVTIGYPLDIVYNATNDQFAVVYRCDDVDDTDSDGDGTPGDVAAPVNGEFEVFFQIVNSDGTLALDNDVQVSFTGGANGTNTEFDAESPAIAWNSDDNQYLVTWGADNAGLGDGNREIFAQRISAAGAPVGSTVQISFTAHGGSKDSVASSVIYNPLQDEYLVVWSGDVLADGDVEIFAQRVNRDASLDGGNFAVSSNGNTSNGAGRPQVVYNDLDDQYMVSWQAAVSPGELEIFVQRLTGLGVPTGTDDLRVSDLGAEGNINFDVAQIHDLTYAGSPINGYFAVWDGDDNRDGQVEDEVEIYGQQIEPVLEVTKSITSSTTSLDAEDTVQYTIVIRHREATEGLDTYDVSLRDAIELAVTDDIPDLFENVQLVSAEILDGANTTDVSGNFSIDGTGDLQTDTRVDLELFTNGAEHERLEIVVSGRLRDTVSPDDVVPANTVDIDWRNRAGLIHPEYDDSAASAAATITDPFAVSKSANVGSAPIGAEITYALSVTVVEGTTNSLILVDSLPANTTYVPASLVVANANGMTVNGLSDGGGPVGGVLTLTATSVLNPGDADAPSIVDTDTMTLAYRVRVDNVLANQDTTMLSNDVDASASGVAADNNNTAFVGVIEPALQLSKTADDVTPVYDQTVTFTVDISHVMGTSTADAFDIVIVDTLPAGLSYVVASVSGATLTSQVGPVLTFDVADLTLGDGAKSFSYQAQVASEGAVAAGAMLTNSQSMTWTSLDGMSANERTGVDGPAGLNDYVTTTSETVTVTAPDLSTSVKAVSDAATGNNDGQAQPGETLRYAITLANTGDGNATGIVVGDAPPVNTSLMVGSVTTSCAGSVVATGNTGGDTAVQVDIANLAMGSCAVTFDVAVDDPVAPGVTQISNAATIASNELTTVTTNTVNIPVDAAPVFSTSSKAVSDAISGNNDGQAQPGEVLTYSITVDNSGDQGASNVVILDAAPVNTSLGVGSVGTTCGGASITTGNSGGDTSVRVDVSTLAGATSCIVTFAVTVEDPLASGVTQICNTATIGSDETTPVLTNNVCINTDGAADLSTSSKVVSDAVSGNNDGQAQPGEMLTYTVTVDNSGDQGASSVVVLDAAPVDTSLDVGSVGTTCSAATITAGNTGGDTTVQVDIPALASSASCDVTFTATVDDPLTAGVTEVCNTATISSDATSAVNTNEICINTDAGADLSTSSKAVSDAISGNNDGQAQPGEVLTYTVTLDNSGDQGAESVVLVDAAPVDTTLDIGSVGTTCGGASITSGNTGGDTTVQVDVPTLAGAALCTVTFTVTVDDPLTSGVTQICNTATIDSAGSAPFDTNQACLSTNGAPDLSSSTKSVADASMDGQALPGEQLTFTVTLVNSGAQGAVDAQVLDEAPLGTSLVVGSVGTTCGGGVIVVGNTAGDVAVRVDIPTLAGGGASCEVSFDVLVDDPVPMGQTTVTNTAQVAAMGQAPVDTTTASIPIQLLPELSATKSVVSDGPFLLGSTVLYSIEIVNLGTGLQPDNPGNELVDELPTELTLVSASASMGVALADLMSNTVTWNGSVASMEQVTITIEATITGGGSGDLIANQATVFWDSNGDGTNESSATSDDPATPEVGDPTVLLIGAILEIPTLGFGGLVLLSVLLLGVVSSRLRGARW